MRATLYGPADHSVRFHGKWPELTVLTQLFKEKNLTLVSSAREAFPSQGNPVPGRVLLASLQHLGHPVWPNRLVYISPWVASLTAWPPTGADRP